MSDPVVPSEKFKVFVSYSRHDSLFADQLVAALEASNFEITLDRKDISGGDLWKERLGTMLLGTHAVVFVLSPASVASKQCADEVEIAGSLSKKLIPVVCASLGGVELPPALSKRNHILFVEDAKFPGSGFGSGLKRLGNDLRTDQEWVRKHKRYVEFATSWSSRAKEPALLNLRGSELVAAERWLAQTPANEDAGALTREFVSKCREAEELEKNKDLRNARRWNWALAGFLVVATGLGFAAALEWRDANAAKNLAETQRAKAVALFDDAADEARLARKQLTDLIRSAKSKDSDLLQWAPASWAGYLHARSASTHGESYNFAKEREELDLALAFEPRLLWHLNSSANNYVNSGDAVRAREHALAGLELDPNGAVVYGNLINAEAILPNGDMLRNYEAALEHIDQELKQAQRRISSVDTLVAPDVQEVTRGFNLFARDTDFQVAMRYLRAVLLAMRGDAKFSAALDDADTADRDCPNSRNAYLEAINWAWLITRGQAMGDARNRGDVAAATQPRNPEDFSDYGALAALGALWERVAITRPEFKKHAMRSIIRFRQSFYRHPQPRYAAILAWSTSRGKVRSGVCTAKESGRLGFALDLEQHSSELLAGPSSEKGVFRKLPVLKLVNEAIETLLTDPEKTTNLPGDTQAGAITTQPADPKKFCTPSANLGRREEDLLIGLLLRRADLQAKEGGVQAAQSDIDCVLQIDNHIADAFVARADTISSLPEKRAALRQALAEQPANETALENLADTYRQYIPSTALNDKLTAHRSLKSAFDLLNSIRRKHLEYALTLLDKRRNLTQLWAWDYEALAKVEADLGLYAKAAADIEMAIRKLPTRFEFYERRYNYELSAKSASAETAMQHFLQGLRERAAYFARASNDEEALRAHVKLFQSAASARDRFGGDEAVANEVQLCIHMITVYLDRRFGRPVAATWWAATMRNPLATKLEQQMAGEEAAKIGAGQ